MLNTLRQRLSQTGLQKQLATITFLLILLLGLTLRAYQYLMGRSLWEDEAHFALNFMKYDLWRLTKPLDYIQAGPILFLLGVKCFALLFGYSELALRALPFIFSLFTLPLFYYIIRDLSESLVAALSGFFLFCVNLAVIYFSSELKPYTLDLSMYLLLIYLAVSKNRSVTAHRYLYLAVAGSFAILLSSVAFIVLFCIGCGFIAQSFTEKKIERRKGVVLVLWLVVFLINYFLFIYDHPATQDQRTNYAFAFCPTNVLSIEFCAFIKKTADETFFTLLLYVSKAYYFSYALVVLFMLALWEIYVRRQWRVFLYVCLPVFIHLLLSALKIYPFWYRLILYLVPCFIYLISVGLAVVVHFIKQKAGVFLAVVLGLVFCFFLSRESIVQFPLWFREIKPALTYVNEMPVTVPLYMSEPAHAYDYYYQRGEAKKRVKEEIPWSLHPGTLQDFISGQPPVYMIFYIPASYREVIDDLRTRGQLLDVFEYQNYGIAVIRSTATNLHAINLNYLNFDKAHTFQEDNTVAIWTGSVESKKVKLAAGNYKITVVSRGTPVGNIYPVNTLYVNGQPTGTFVASKSFERDTFSCFVNSDTGGRIKIQLDNDEQTKDEDRNTFIKTIIISPRLSR